MNLHEYQDFVQAVTSNPSNYLYSLLDRIDKLSNSNQRVNLSLLLTGAIGLGSETGELNEIVKKVLFQGKELDEQTEFHLKRELGDIIFYWINTCRALGLDPQEVIDENVNKLQSRYPGGFSVELSENRKEGDL